MLSSYPVRADEEKFDNWGVHILLILRLYSSQLSDTVTKPLSVSNDSQMPNIEQNTELLLQENRWI